MTDIFQIKLLPVLCPTTVHSIPDYSPGRIIELHKQNLNMKKSIITVLFGMGVFFAFSQKGNNPPDNVSKSFQKEYPKSQPAQWTQSKTGWNVDFEDKDNNNGEATAHFDANGKHLDTRVPYDNKDVPAPVVKNVKSRYPGSDNLEYTRIDRPGEAGVYQVNLSDKGAKKTVYMDNKGQQKDYKDNH
jgi:hypothetical protein